MTEKQKKMHNSLLDHFKQFMRNGRWGTCASCPRDNQNHAYPEFCEYTDRYDHQLTLDELTESYKSYMKDVKE